jgi:asparagine synthase (glutamine-hydrolysing)
MCGIVGFLTTQAKPPAQFDGALCSMVDAIAHRGPDDRGSVGLDAGGCSLGLGSTRLAIIDISPAGHQPMRGASHETHIVYNGEVYNFKNLRDGLSQDFSLKSQTDTEVVLRAYEKWGAGSFSKLRGMFAMAIWDGKANKMLLARDPLGIKPLYYYSDDSLFLFASEIRSLLASGMISRTLDPEGVASYLNSGAVEAPATIIKGIKSVLPGHYLAVGASNGRLTVEEVNYAANLFKATSPPRDRAEAVDVLRSTLEGSARLHLLSDVPLAVFLSGGIDSSAIVALISRVSAAKLKTFTVVFEEKHFSEQSYARLVADRFGTEHTEIMLSEKSCYEMMPDALSAMDQPTIDGLNTYVISRAVKQAGVTVALSGLGGDELFAGYPSFRRAVRLQGLDRIPHGVREAMANAGKSLLGRSVYQKKAWQLLADGGSPRSVYSASRQLFSVDEIKELMLPETLGGLLPVSNGVHVPNSLDTVNAISQLEIEGYMANMLLRDADQMSMAHSLELRVPFVDTAVVSYVMRLPGIWKIDGDRHKPLLLDALGNLIPTDVSRRPKMGFTLPMERWVRSKMKPKIDTTLRSARDLSRLGLSGAPAAVWSNFMRNSRRERWARPWAIHVLSQWCELNNVQM